MYKLEIPIGAIDPNLLHEELGDLGERYYLTFNTSKIFLQFPEIKDVNELDEEGLEAGVVNHFKKVITQETIQDEEGKDIVKDIVTYEQFDFTAMQSIIDNKIANHDPNIRVNRLHNEQTIAQIKETDSEFLRVVEEIALKMVELGHLNIAQKQLDRITFRINKRNQLR